MPKKISFFISHLGVGGAQRVTINLAKGFADLNYDVEIIAIDGTGELLTSIPSNVEVTDLNCRGAHLSIFPLKNHIEARDPDILYSSITYLNICSLMAVNLSNKSPKTVISEHSKPNDRRDPRYISKTLSSLSKILYNKSDCIIAVSDDIATEVSTMSGVDIENIYVLDNPVIDAQFEELANTEVSHEWITSPNYKVILSVGRLGPRKDFQTLIKSFKSLSSKYDDLRLLILGDGENRQLLEDKLSKLGLSDVASIHGYVDNPYPFMKESDVFVLSSTTEGFPSVLVESLACRTPVVSTDCSSSIPKILEGIDSCKITPVGNPQLMADCVKSVLSSSVNEGELRRVGYEYSTTSLVPVYEELLGKI